MSSNRLPSAFGKAAGAAKPAVSRNAWFILLALASWALPAPSAKTGPGSQSKASAEAGNAGPATALDSNKVHTLYMNGDFDEAIALLEGALKGNRRYRHDDSVFIFKHLGVMYAAEERTREKGRHYMYRLLTVEPTARILDMYASDMIYMIFKNIQEEFAVSMGRKAHADTTLGRGLSRVPESGDRPARNPPEKKSASGYWVGATAAVLVAAGVASWFYFADEPKVTSRNFRPQ